MSLSDQDRDYIHEVAVNAATEVSKQIIEDLLKWHIQACPHGKAIFATKWTMIGACLASSVGSGTAVAAIFKVLGA